MYFLTLKISFREAYGENPGSNELSEFSHPLRPPPRVSLGAVWQNSAVRW